MTAIESKKKHRVRSNHVTNMAQPIRFDFPLHTADVTALGPIAKHRKEYIQLTSQHDCEIEGKFHGWLGWLTASS